MFENIFLGSVLSYKFLFTKTCQHPLRHLNMEYIATAMPEILTDLNSQLFTQTYNKYTHPCVHSELQIAIGFKGFLLLCLYVASKV